MALTVLHSLQAGDNPSKVIRVLEPLRRLSAAGLIQAVPIEADLPGALRALGTANAVFLHLIDMNVHAAPALLALVAEAKRKGVPVVCDTDDPYFFGPEGYSFDEALALHLSVRKQLLTEADLVTVTTAPLQQELMPLAPRAAVIPNLVDMTAVAPPSETTSGRLRIGWCGGPTHVDDLARFLPAMAWLQRHMPVDFVIFGMFDRNIEDTAKRARSLSPQARAQDAKLAAFGRMADALASVRYQHVPSVPYDRFIERLAALRFDIGVCPLQDTRFNRCRSAIKFYQYAATHTVTVASNVEPYREGCTLLADDSPASWQALLEPLARDAKLRQKHLAEQRAYVQAERSWQAGLGLYQRLLSSPMAFAEGASC